MDNDAQVALLIVQMDCEVCSVAMEQLNGDPALPEAGYRDTNEVCPQWPPETRKTASEALLVTMPTGSARISDRCGRSKPKYMSLSMGNGIRPTYMLSRLGTSPTLDIL